MIGGLLIFGSALVAIPVFLATGYLFVLSLASRRTSAPAATSTTRIFAIVVPAHNESVGIARTVANLRTIDWPAEQTRIVVVADNCTDDTAVLAEAAGATVLIRDDTSLRGKGYALAFGFERSLADGCDAVVVVDADSVVSPNLLRAFSARIDWGAEAVQADYAVENVAASWRTRLMAIALGMFHILRSLGRERLGVSCGLRGNGMCFTRAVLAAVPHEAYSVVEDVEYGIRLAEAGYRVHYAEDAHVYGEMVTGEKASRSQRQRWESGRAQLVRLHARRLLSEALRDRDLVRLDLAADLLVPPLSTLCVGVAVALMVLAPLPLLVPGREVLQASLPWLACAAFLGTYGVRGWWLSGTGLAGLLALLRAPGYVVWKIGLKLRRRGQREDEWVRTRREGETPP